MQTENVNYAPEMGLTEVPADLRRVAVTLVSLYGIDEPDAVLFIAQSAAVELGRVSGASGFLPASASCPPTYSAIRNLALRLFGRYATCKGMADRHAGPAAIATQIRAALALANGNHGLQG